ncbi:hypothetical protein ACQP2Y_16830 [Actinoplanes sp. CA-051413]|uniref:hypothetical protein n=1 Tax=Actinoplanes sp. CA-051413 TaxID=3239899 RepID=UPI003D97DF6F
MITRWLPLYLRSRRVPPAVAISLATVSAVALIWSPEAGPGLAALTVVLALAPLIPTLAGDDDALEQTAALPWPPRRALHLLGAGTFVAVLLLVARVAGADFGPAGQIIRNSAGLAGLIGLGVALLGTRLAWAAPVVWSALQAMLAVPGGPAWQQSLLWLIQPAGSVPAAITATVLLLAGVISYAARVRQTGAS